MDRFSERMLKLIQDNNITYEELETKTGIPRSTLQRYATGTNKKIPIDRVKNDCNGFRHFGSIFNRLGKQY